MNNKTTIRVMMSCQDTDLYKKVHFDVIAAERTVLFLARNFQQFVAATEDIAAILETNVAALNSAYDALERAKAMLASRYSGNVNFVVPKNMSYTFIPEEGIIIYEYEDCQVD